MLIATAGHIDHGKTSLVKALTGTDTDRLPQEKASGISIDLGFAYHALGSDTVFGFVDVPGHEKFIRNMLAGVASVDAAILVVAADDGPMPQTIEHLAILNLLGLEHAVVAITKTDRVELTQLEKVKQEVTRLISNTSLKNAQLFAVSATTSTGISALKEHLHALRDDLPKISASGRFRLAVDRQFSLTGVGSVVTGTVFSGAIRVGDELTLSPGQHAVRVRSLHIQDEPASGNTLALAGDRCALNLVGLNTAQRQAKRGDWLSDGPPPEPTQRFDGIVQVMASETRALKHWTPVHVHHGASSLTGRIAPLEGKEILPGQSALAQFVLDQPALLARGDRFIVRDQSARRTLGGGEVLDGFGVSKGRSKPERLEQLRAMQLPSAQEAFAKLAELIPDGVDVDRFTQTWNLTDLESRSIVDQLSPKLLTLQGRQIALTRQRWSNLQDGLLAGLTRWHSESPERFGPSASELRHLVGIKHPKRIIDECIDQLVRSSQIMRVGVSLKLAGHEPTVSQHDLDQWALIVPYLGADQLKPPVVSALAESLKEDQTNLESLLRRCSLRGQLVKATPNRYFHPEAIARLAAIAQQTAQEHGGELKVQLFRDASGIGRNLTIEILEFFDALGFTRRLENTRHIIKPLEQVFGAGLIASSND